MKTHRHQARAFGSTFKPKDQIYLSITFPVQPNHWRRVAETGCKRFLVVRAGVRKLYAVALCYPKTKYPSEGRNRPRLQGVSAEVFSFREYVGADAYNWGPFAQESPIKRRGLMIKRKQGHCRPACTSCFAAFLEVWLDPIE
jgi:hypothetical protein